MSELGYQEVISVPSVADGNPATAMALEASAVHAGIEATLLHLSLTSPAINFFHRRISRDPTKAAQYTEDSEVKRVSPLVRAGSAAMFGEFAARLYARGLVEPIRWSAVQEHQLLSASPRIMKRLGIVSTRLVVPDVFPKESAVVALDRHEGAVMSVWNTDAFKELSGRGVNVELNEPFLTEGFLSDKERFSSHGSPVVVKTSGNGMPQLWQDLLLEVLGKTDVEWDMFTPKAHYSSEHEPLQLSQTDRIRTFYGLFGEGTRVLVGGPTELTSVAAGVRKLGGQIHMITLPPRGVHERRNLEFARDHGLVFGELDFSGVGRRATVEGVRLIPVYELKEILADLDRLPRAGKDLDYIGTTSVWADA